MNRPTAGSLFSGVGGIDLAFSRVGFDIRWQVEIDLYCQRILAQHAPEYWPNARIYDDVKRVGKLNLEPVDVIFGGFPCTDISNAGKKAGIKEGTRSGLWIEFARIIGQLRPAVVLLENVAAITSRDGIRVISDLTKMGYDAEWGVIPASAVGAPHQRKRWFCVAYCQHERRLSGRTHIGDGYADLRAERVAEEDNRGRQEFLGGTGAGSAYELGYAERAERGGIARRGSGPQSADGRSQFEQLGDAAGEGLPQSRPTGLAAHEAQSRAGLVAQPERTGELADATRLEMEGSRATRLEVAGLHAGQGLSERDGAERGKTDWPTQSVLGRTVDGLSRQLDCSRWPARPGEAQHSWEAPRLAYGVPDRVARIKALGNAVVPQVVQPIAEAIYEFLCEQGE